MKHDPLFLKWKNQLVAYLSLPLHRNGLALVFSLVVTSGLGILYWALAARLYPPEVVGLNSAITSAMMFIGIISQFGMVNFLTRFIPRAGRASGRMVVYTYLIAIAASAVIGTIFILGVGLWSPELGVLAEQPKLSIWFVGTTVYWCIFALQDGALIGLRRATWVPVENLVFALAKISLLFLLIGSLKDYGIFGSWSFPLPLLVLVVNLFIFLKFIPAHVRDTQAGAEVYPLSQMVRFVGGDYLSKLVWSVTLNLMPVIILEKIGPVGNAHFYLPWMITYSLYLVSTYLGMSLTAEAAKDPQRLIEYAKRSLTQAGLLISPVVLLILAGAPFILSVFGEGYAAEGVTLLRFLALSAIPYILVSLYVSIARVRRQVMRIVIYLSLLCVTAVALSLVLLTTFGLPGIGIAWLISQAVVALAILFIELLPLLKRAGQPHMNKRLSITWLVSLWNASWFLPYRRALLEDISTRLAGQGIEPPPGTWQIQHYNMSLSSMTVLSLGPSPDSLQAIVYISNSGQAARNFQHRAKVLACLNSEPSLQKWRHQITRVLCNGQLNGHPYWVVNRLPGILAANVISDPSRFTGFFMNAADWIAQFHRATASEVVVGKQELADWVRSPVERIARSRLALYTRDCRKTLDTLAASLSRALNVQKMTVSWTHGDYWPDNILITPEDMEVTGVIDWEQAQPGMLPALDLVNLMVSTRRGRERREMGGILVALLEKPDLYPFEKKVWDDHISLTGGQSPGFRTTLFLFWLQHVDSLLKKRDIYSYNPVWIWHNFIKIIRWIENNPTLV